jgi:uncharacterized membrane protein
VQLEHLTTHLATAGVIAAAAAEVDNGGAIAISEGDPVCLSDKGDVIWVCAWVEVPVTAPGGAV